MNPCIPSGYPASFSSFLHLCRISVRGEYFRNFLIKFPFLSVFVLFPVHISPVKLDLYPVDQIFFIFRVCISESMRSPGYRSQYESFRCVEFKYMQQFRQQEIRFFAPPPFCLPVFFRVCRKKGRKLHIFGGVPYDFHYP